MDRKDLGPELNGWQVLDPTPQERSGGLWLILSILLYKNVRSEHSCSQHQGLLLNLTLTPSFPPLWLQESSAAAQLRSKPSRTTAWTCFMTSRLCTRRWTLTSTPSWWARAGWWATAKTRRRLEPSSAPKLLVIPDTRTSPETTNTSHVWV